MSLTRVGLIVAIALMWTACITPMKPTSKSTSPNTTPTEDSLQLKATLVSTNAMTIMWSKSKMSKDTFERYSIKVEGRYDDGTLVYPNGKDILSIDSLKLELINLIPNTTYGVQASSYDKNGKLRAQDEMLVTTTTHALQYVQKGQYTFPENEYIIDYAIPPLSNAVFVATNKAVYQFDQYISASPINVFTNDSIEHMTVSNDNIFYSTRDNLYVRDQASGATSSTHLPHITNLKVSEDGLFLYAATRDSLVFLTSALVSAAGNLNNIKFVDNPIRDFCNYPLGTQKFYVATQNGLFYASADPNLVSSMEVASQGEKNYTAVYAFDDTVYVGRSAEKNDPGGSSTLNHYSLHISPITLFNNNFNPMTIKNIYVDNRGAISALINKNLYIVFNKVLHLVPKEGNIAFGEAEKFVLLNDVDYYVAGKNKICLFTWLYSN